VLPLYKGARTMRRIQETTKGRHDGKEWRIHLLKKRKSNSWMKKKNMRKDDGNKGIREKKGLKSWTIFYTMFVFRYVQWGLRGEKVFLVFVLLILRVESGWGRGWEHFIIIHTKRFAVILSRIIIFYQNTIVHAFLKHIYIYAIYKIKYWINLFNNFKNI